MIWLAVGFVVCLILSIAVVKRGDIGNGWIFLGVAVFSFGAFMCGISLAIIGLSRHYNRVNCQQFAEQTRRETKFVIYNQFAKGVCLTPTADGKWIPTDNLREFGERP